MWETKYLSPARDHRDNLVYNILDDQEEENRRAKGSEGFRVDYKYDYYY